MARRGRIHLRVRSRMRTACGLLIDERVRRTDLAADVTCDRCLRSFFMADQDVMQVGTSRRSNQ